MTGHIGTTTPKFEPLAGDDRALTLLKQGCANSVVGLELAEPKQASLELFAGKKGISGRNPRVLADEGILNSP